MVDVIQTSYKHLITLYCQVFDLILFAIILFWRIQERVTQVKARHFVGLLLGYFFVVGVNVRYIFLNITTTTIIATIINNWVLSENCQELVLT